MRALNLRLRALNHDKGIMLVQVAMNYSSASCVYCLLQNTLFHTLTPYRL